MTKKELQENILNYTDIELYTLDKLYQDTGQHNKKEVIVREMKRRNCYPDAEYILDVSQQ